MAEKIDCGWLVGYDDKKFLPKTITSQILNTKGTYLFPNGDDNIGNSIRIMYIDHGVLTESEAVVGSHTQPVFLTNGQITAFTQTIGSAIKPIWFNSGVITESDANVATDTKLMYLLKGELTASAADVGDANSPVYLKTGIITTVGTIATDHGGTGVNSHTANRLVWSKSATELQAASHYVDADYVAINSESKPSYNLYVNGTSGFSGVMTTTNGNIISTAALNLVASPTIDFYLGTAASPTSRVGGFNSDGDLEIVNNVKILVANKGYKLTDSSGTEYYGIMHNDTNLWIGGYTSSQGGHTGGTYISSGYDSTNSAGFATVYIAVPNADNTSQSIYSILHNGNYTGFLNGTYVNAAGDTMTGNLNFKKSLPSILFYESSLTRGTAPDSNTSWKFMVCNDNAGSNLSYMREYFYAAGGNFFEIVKVNSNAATAASFYLRLGYNADGTNYINSDATTGTFSSMAATFSTVKGAVWNDYAEYRETKEEIIPGRVVIETGLGDLVLATERLQPGANIISDTFGFSIGETEKSKTPIAVSGRVLAYPYEDRYSYNPGDAVCTGPNGTVSKMTREEIIQYPERIVGTVSEIPEYDTWGENNTLVNNRIWIKVK